MDRYHIFHQYTRSVNFSDHLQHNTCSTISTSYLSKWRIKAFHILGQLSNSNTSSRTIMKQIIILMRLFCTLPSFLFSPYYAIVLNRNFCNDLFTRFIFMLFHDLWLYLSILIWFTTIIINTASSITTYSVKSK